MESARTIAALAAAATIAGCAGVEITTDFDEGQNFSPWQTWSWIPEMEMEEETSQTADVGFDNPVVHSRIRSAIAKTLAAKGYRKVDGAADFWVAYHIQVEDKKETFLVSKTYTTAYTQESVRSRQTYAYREGTLAIDLANPEKRKLVWRGIAVGELSQGTRPEKIDEEVNDAVAAILAKFPPPPASR